MRVVTFLILETTQGSSLNAPAMARPTEGPIPPPVEAATHQQFIDSPHCLLSGVWPDRTDGQCYKGIVLSVRVPAPIHPAFGQPDKGGLSGPVRLSGIIGHLQSPHDSHHR